MNDRPIRGTKTSGWATAAAEAAKRTQAAVCVAPHPPHSGLAQRLTVKGVLSDAGGMALIEEVLDENLRRIAARKIPRPGADDPATVRALIEEAQITSQLDHPNIVPVHELGTDDRGRVFFTMKLVRGRTLTDGLRKQDVRTRTERDLFAHLQVFLKVCDAVAFAHSRGVLHRDLKPDNVMVGEFGEVYVVDWGVAQVCGRPADPSDASRIVGTPNYMAPEQATGDAVDERTDVFLLGGILYEILTLQPPYSGASPKELVAMAMDAEVVPPAERAGVALPLRLCRIATKALSWDPAHRHASAAELRGEVESFLQSAWQLPRKTFPAGAMVIREGEPGDAAYIVAGGTCRAFRTANGAKVVLEEMSSGDVFGEIAVLTKQPRAASVEAIDELTVLVMTRDYFEEEIGSSFWMSLFLQALAQRFRGVSKRATDAETSFARARTAEELLRTLLRAGTEASPGVREARWSDARDRIAAFLGCAPDAVAAHAEESGFVVDAARDAFRLK